MPFYIHKDALLLHEGIKKNLLSRCNLETFLGNEVITEYGILLDVFSKEELKETGIV